MAAIRPLTAGIHLPQAGPAAYGEAMRRAAVLAEELGFADVWVSDHLVVPTNAEYPPSAYVYEPLAWVAASTRSVRLGTTVLVLPMRNPLVVAKMVASIDRMSGGRFILGTAAGWLEAEFHALGVPFAERGRRTDVALARAARAGDGWHGAFLSPEQTARRVLRLRAERPEPEFTISMRTRWDALEDDGDAILHELERYREARMSHFVAEPKQRTADGYPRSIEALAALLPRAGVAMVR